MKNTRLIALLQTLSNKEVRALRQFVRSPFFNKRLEVSILFDYLEECLNLHKIVPSKEQIFKQVHSSLKKEMPYDDQTMRLWMSFLLKLIEKYLVYNEFFEDEIKTKIKLSKVYRERNLPKQFKRTVKEIENLQTKSPYRNAAFYTNNFEIQFEQYRFVTATKRMGELNIQQIFDDLDVGYFSQKLRHSCLALAHQTVYKTKYDFGLIEEVLAYVENKKLLEIPAIAVYYHAYQTLYHIKKTMYFRAFKEAIEKHGGKIPKDELGNIYIMAINFCIGRYNEGSRAYLKDQFELYQQGIAQDLFLNKNKLSRFAYRNIVTVGLVQKEYNWVENFIYNYKSKLDKNYQESIFSFCLANLSYNRKEYGKAMDLLDKSVYKDLLLNLAGKTLSLKILYELDEFDRVYAHLEAMRTFIRRKKIMGYHKENYLNLLFFTKKLLEVNPYVKEEKLNLQKEVEVTESIAEKDWLLKQFL